MMVAALVVTLGLVTTGGTLARARAATNRDPCAKLTNGYAAAPVVTPECKTIYNDACGVPHKPKDAKALLKKLAATCSSAKPGPASQPASKLNPKKVEFSLITTGGLLLVVNIDGGKELQLNRKVLVTSGAPSFRAEGFISLKDEDVFFFAEGPTDGEENEHGFLSLNAAGVHKTRPESEDLSHPSIPKITRDGETAILSFPAWGRDPARKVIYKDGSWK